MSESTTTNRVIALVMPILTDLGLDLYDLEFGAGLLKVTVDRPGGVNLDEIALVTRLVNRELDHQDPIPGKYTLEVSSPGIERALRRPDHFTRIIGATVSVRLRDVTHESRRMQGVLVAADGEGITVRPDDEPTTQRTVLYQQIDRARTVFVWSPEAKATPKAKAPQAAPSTPTTNQEVTA